MPAESKIDEVNHRLRKMFAIDPRSLGLFRICFGLSLVLDLAQQAAILGEMTTDAGSLPRSLHRQLYSPVEWWSLHLLGGAWAFEAGLYALTFVTVAAFIVGYRTRWVTLALWVLLTSLHNRHPMFGTASDSVRRLLLFWGFFLPLGSRFSLDRRWGRDTSSDRPIVGVATIAILLQVAFVYLGAALSKDYDTWVRQGTATMLAMRLDIFATRFGKALLQYPALLKATSVYTWWVELVMPIVAFSPLHNSRARLLAIASFIALHAGLYLCMVLGAFPFLMMAAWMLFLPPLFWSWLERLSARGGDRPVPGNQAGSRPWSEGRIAGVFVSVCLALVVLWNVQTIGKGFSQEFPVFVRNENVIKAMRIMKLTQSWGVFAPHPSHKDGWLMVVATLRDGSKVDLFRDGRPVDWTKPAHVGDIYKNTRWTKYTANLVSRGGRRHRPAYAEMLVRRWNADQPESRRVKRVEIIYVVEMTQPDMTEGPLKNDVLWQGDFPPNSPT